MNLIISLFILKTFGLHSHVAENDHSVNIIIQLLQISLQGFNFAPDENIVCALSSSMLHMDTWSITQ